MERKYLNIVVAKIVITVKHFNDKKKNTKRSPPNQSTIQFFKCYYFGVFFVCLLWTGGVKIVTERAEEEGPKIKGLMGKKT